MYYVGKKISGDFDCSMVAQHGNFDAIPKNVGDFFENADSWVECSSDIIALGWEFWMIIFGKFKISIALLICTTERP